MPLPFLLSGPFLRRTERNGVYIWLATSQQTTDIEPLVYTLSKDASGKWNTSNVPIVYECTTHQLGKQLFVTLLLAKLPQGGRFDVNVPYGYDLHFTLPAPIQVEHFQFPVASKVTTKLQQFRFSEIFNHEGVFSYAGMPHPVFVVPDTSKSKTSIIYGSCRRTNGPGSDALNGADKMLTNEWEKWSPGKKDPPPAYVLFHTGDQIYTDDLSEELFNHVRQIADELMGPNELIPCYEQPPSKPKKDTGILNLLEFLDKYIDGEKGYDILDVKVLRWIEFNDHKIKDGRRKNVLLVIREFLSTVYKANLRKETEKGFLSGKTGLSDLVMAALIDVLDFSNNNGGKTDRDTLLQQLDTNNTAIDCNEILPRSYITDPGKKFSLISAASINYKQRKPFVRINTSFSTTDEGHLLTFGEIAALYLLNWGSFHLSIIPAGDINKGNLEGMEKGNLRFRRLMANVPSYMMFDDHDVTDDWNGDETWRTKVERSAAGKRIVANALAAFWAFQGWGNTPDVYLNTPLVESILKHLQYFSQHGQEQSSLVQAYEKETWQFDRWTFVAPTNPLAVFMDTRTMREKESKMDYQPEYLPDNQGSDMLDFLTDTAVLTAVGALYKDQQKKTKIANLILAHLMMRDVARREHREIDSLKNDYLAVNMFPDNAYRELYVQLLKAGYLPGQTLIFCAATPVICSYLLQKAQKKAVDGSFNKDYVVLKLFKTFVKPGRYSQDWELWWCHPKGKYEFFKFLDLTVKPGKVIVLSGDVHVGFHISGTLTSEITGRQIKVEQICSSALKNNQLGKEEKSNMLAYLSMEDTKDIEYKKVNEKYPAVGMPVKKNHFVLKAQMRKYKPIMDPDSWIIWENNVGVLHYNNDKGQDKLENSFLFNRNYNSDVIECRPDPISPEKDAFLNHLKNFIPVADALLLWEALKRI